MKALQVQKFNLLCNTPKNQWYKFEKNYGYVAFFSKKNIKKAFWAKTKKEAIKRYLNDTY